MKTRLGARSVAFLCLAAVAAAIFVRLGVWQLDRLAQRRRRNALIVERLRDPPIALAAMPRDTAAAHFRRVVIDGRYDYTHELSLTDRSRDGSPGVHVITPLRVDGTDTAYLIDRGWVYSPDGTTIDRTRWREGDRVAGVARVQELPPALPQAATRAGYPGDARWLSPDAIGRWAGYPVAPVLLALDGDTSTTSTSVPARSPPQPLDEGPHLNYAIQWFAFATIAVVGTLVAVFRPPARTVPLAPPAPAVPVGARDTPGGGR
jgi:surfeit locus 1 family protein